MFRLHTRWALPTALVLATPMGIEAQRLFEAEGIELRGTARIVEFGAATCNVVEERETATSYERKKVCRERPRD